jgi:hypothetical protein
MMAAHTARLIPHGARPSWARAVLVFEPVIPSLFLLLVGWSLSRSFARTRSLEGGEATGRWFARQARRAAGLWAVSALFFVAEYGLRLPDALLTGGILAVIAYSILLVGATLSTGRAALPLLMAVLAAGAFAFWKLDASGRSLYPLTEGSAPFLPMMLFALAGAISGAILGGTWIRGFFVLAGGLAAAWLIARHGGEALFLKPLGRAEAGRDLAAPLFSGGEARYVGFYNLRPVLAAACLGLQLAVLGVLGAALRKIPENAARFVFALGRHALAVYILHLAILAVLVTALGKQPLSAVSGTLTWLGLILVCQAAAIFLQTKKRV